MHKILIFFTEFFFQMWLYFIFSFDISLLEVKKKTTTNSVLLIYQIEIQRVHFRMVPTNFNGYPGIEKWRAHEIGALSEVHVATWSTSFFPVDENQVEKSQQWTLQILWNSHVTSTHVWSKWANTALLTFTLLPIPCGSYVMKFIWRRNILRHTGAINKLQCCTGK